jgi:flagellar motor switch protein FliN
VSDKDYLSQEQIEKLLNEAGQIKDGSALFADDFLTRDEQDVLGEIGNISMGTAATTMFSLLGKKVTITTPSISMHTLKTLSEEYPAPLVVVEVNYTEGLTGKNLLILKEYDVALITSLLLGESEDIDPDAIELDETHISAIREVMNQMIGSSATSLADILMTSINISTPQAKQIQLNDQNISEGFADQNEPIVKINFKMEIEELLTSEIMQILPLKFAKALANRVIQGAEQPEEPPAQIPSMQTTMQEAPAAKSNMIQSKQNVDVKAAQFPSFDTSKPTNSALMDNLSMILDVPMKVTVELGKAKKKIKDILDFNMGSVIVLDKIAGEAVDILVNGKIVGKGEVVVIDDNYGVRITEINLSSTMELL